MVCVHVFYFLFSYCFRLEAVKWSHIVGLIWFALLWCLVMSSVCSGAYYLLLCLLWGKLFSSGLPSIFELVDLSFHSRASYLVKCMISKLSFILRTEEIAQWAKCLSLDPHHMKIRWGNECLYIIAGVEAWHRRIPGALWPKQEAPGSKKNTVQNN